MCFSASASLAAGVTIGVIGLATLPMVSERRELPFASLPLVFAVHQLLEAAIWTQVEAAGEAVRTPAVVIWLGIAWLLLPIGIPLAVRLFEPDPGRRRLMLALAVCGAVIGGVLTVGSIGWSTSAGLSHDHLEYALPIRPGWVLSAPYVVVTCGALLASSQRFVVAFGAALFGSMALSTVMDAREFSSVWCFFAALLSTMLFVHYLVLRLRTPALSRA